ncbi:MBL fold metallo-hydrolase [Paenibacillus sp. GCM10027629]|uniref:MBL fold metallo-hydrolase n=1 Tax=Paenibacillus sp. GCM10027629 TaxID=3273414 RepID=UPI003643EEF3
MNTGIGIEALEISAHLMGEQRIIYPTLIWDENETILIDTGYPGQLPLFQEAFERVGKSLQTLSKIIITHHDLDHIGGLPSFVAHAEDPIEVISNAIEKPYIQGEQRIMKFTDEVVASMDSWPPERAIPFKRLLANPPAAPVNTLVADGEILPYCGGIIIINTPGHTPGHFSVYYQASKTLIAGDAMVVENGQLLGPDPRYSIDLAQANASIQKLTSYDITRVIAYHGGLFEDHVNQRIAELASQL